MNRTQKQAMIRMIHGNRQQGGYIGRLVFLIGKVLTPRMGIACKPKSLSKVSGSFDNHGESIPEADVMNA